MTPKKAPHVKPMCGAPKFVPLTSRPGHPSEIHEWCERHRFKSAVQFVTTVTGAMVCCSMVVATRKRWPSAVTA